jgi:ribosomal protein L20
VTVGELVETFLDLLDDSYLEVFRKVLRNANINDEDEIKKIITNLIKREKP